MSRASGQCRFADGIVMHYIYEGTGDTTIPGLFTTSKAAWDAWNGDEKSLDDMMAYCDCEGEPVELADDYGNGDHWSGKACRTHTRITKGRWNAPLDYLDDDELHDGLPDWWIGVRPQDN